MRTPVSNRTSNAMPAISIAASTRSPRGSESSTARSASLPLPLNCILLFPCGDFSALTSGAAWRSRADQKRPAYPHSWASNRLVQRDRAHSHLIRRRAPCQQLHAHDRLHRLHPAGEESAIHSSAQNIQISLYWKAEGLYRFHTLSQTRTIVSVAGEAGKMSQSNANRPFPWWMEY